jgi:hypothetical protein
MTALKEIDKLAAAADNAIRALAEMDAVPIERKLAYKPFLAEAIKLAGSEKGADAIAKAIDTPAYAQLKLALGPQAHTLAGVLASQNASGPLRRLGGYTANLEQLLASVGATPFDLQVFVVRWLGKTKPECFGKLQALTDNSAALAKLKAERDVHLNALREICDAADRVRERFQLYPPPQPSLKAWAA